jgi:hypothetical protein
MAPINRHETISEASKPNQGDPAKRLDPPPAKPVEQEKNAVGAPKLAPIGRQNDRFGGATGG